MSKKKRPIRLARANVVGIIHTQAGFKQSQRADLDAVEVRVDILPRPPLPAELSVLSHPVILTVRRFDEGGARPLADTTRLALYLELLPAAAAVDLEIKSLRALREVVAATHRTGKPLILSHHDFLATPTLARLRTLAARARDGGADIVKIATTTETPADIARLLTLLDESTTPLAVMGMGTLGRAARLLFARAGSVLNYGWLDKPQVSGQWGAVEFRALLARA
ncbi:MAG: type I 3-dehydroquinate dehydratase [Verrucomicrobiota bacterium]